MHKIIDFILMILFIIASIWVVASLLNAASHMFEQPKGDISYSYVIAARYPEVERAIAYETFNELSNKDSSLGDHSLVIQGVVLPQDVEPVVFLRTIVGFYMPDQYVINAMAFPYYNRPTGLTVCQCNLGGIVGYSCGSYVSKYTVTEQIDIQNVTNTHLREVLYAHKILIPIRYRSYTLIYSTNDNIYMVERLYPKYIYISILQRGIDEAEPNMPDVFVPDYFGLTTIVYETPDIYYAAKENELHIGPVIPVEVTYYDKPITGFKEEFGTVFNMYLWST